MKIKELLSKAWWVVILPAIYFIVRLFTKSDTSKDISKDLKDIKNISKDINNASNILKDSSNAVDKAISNSKSKVPTANKDIKKILTDL